MNEYEEYLSSFADGGRLLQAYRLAREVVSMFKPCQDSEDHHSCSELQIACTITNEIEERCHMEQNFDIVRAMAGKEHTHK